MSIIRPAWGSLNVRVPATAPSALAGGGSPPDNGGTPIPPWPSVRGRGPDPVNGKQDGGQSEGPLPSLAAAPAPTAPSVIVPGGELPLLDGRPPGSVVAVDRWRGTLTCAVPGDPTVEPALEPVLVRVPTTAAAAGVVEHEARLLVELRRRRLGPIERSIPRHAGTGRVDGTLVAMASPLPGEPMCPQRPGWPSGVQPRTDRRNFQWAAEWLAGLHTASATSRARLDWPDQVMDLLHQRWEGHRRLRPALQRLEPAATRLAEYAVWRTAVHGDFWHGNVLVGDDGITGVVNWYDGEVDGSPLRDLARFALTYGWPVRRQPAQGRSVVGRAGLAPAGGTTGVRLALLGRGWYPRTVRSFLQEGLARLGVAPEEWYDVAVAGVAEIAARAPDPTVAEAHLDLLAELPALP